MVNPFFYLAGLLILASYPTGDEPLGFARNLIAPWVALGFVAFYAGICWTVLRTRPYNSTLLQLILRGLALILYGELIFLFHFPLWVLLRLGVEDPLASSLLGLSPLFTMYGILAVIRARLWPRSGGLRFAFRTFAGLALLPMLLIMLLDEVFQRIDALRRLAFVYPSVMWVAAFAGLGCIMTCLPPLLRFIFGARDFEPGPLRDRLERTAAAAGYGGSRLLIVPTGSSRMANAFVAGLSSVWRYVFFTEAIVRGMSDEHLECVLAHEVTHARKRHILFYLVATLAFGMITGLAHEELDAADVPGPVLVTLLMGWMGLYWGAGFTFISRRFEMEADLVAARLVPPAPGGVAPYAGARSMAGALHRVADLNDVPITGMALRHFSIAQRIDILLRAEIDPSVGGRFEHVCDRLRRVVPVIVAAAAICGGVLVGRQHLKAGETLALLEAHELVDQGRRDLEEGRYPEALEHLTKGIDAGSSGAQAWFWRADAERALGRVADARKSEEMGRQRGSSDPRLRLRAAP